jgi:heptaprenyl diphosphate synthase
MLFAAGAMLFPSFLMQQDIVVRAMQIALFVLLNALSGRHIRVVQYLLVSAGILAFNLVIPTGRVLLAPLGLAITEGALRSGLLKATAMTGLIALSQFSIRAELRFPGRMGGLVGRSLYYFERIMGGRRRIDRRDIIGSVDALLLEVHNAGPAEAAGTSPRIRSTPPGIAILFLSVAASWGAFIFTVFHPRPLWGG